MCDSTLESEKTTGDAQKHDRFDRLDGSVVTTYVRINTCNTNQGDHACRSRIALTDEMPASFSCPPRKKSAKFIIDGSMGSAIKAMNERVKVK
jgi:hypothetical protein